MLSERKNHIMVRLMMRGMGGEGIAFLIHDFIQHSTYIHARDKEQNQWVQLTPHPRFKDTAKKRALRRNQKLTISTTNASKSLDPYNNAKSHCTKCNKLPYNPL